MKAHCVKLSPATDLACNTLCKELEIPRRYHDKIPYAELVTRFPAYYKIFREQEKTIVALQKQIEQLTKRNIQLKELKKKWVPLVARKIWADLTLEGKRTRKKKLNSILKNLIPHIIEAAQSFDLPVFDSLFDLFLVSKAGKRFKKEIKSKIIYKLQKHVPPEAIVELKDMARISDNAYRLLRQLLPQILPSEYYMKKKREEINEFIWEFLPDVAYTGFELDPRLFLLKVLPHYHTISEGDTIPLFGSVDAAQVQGNIPAITQIGFKFGNHDEPKNCLTTGIWEGKDTRHLIKRNAPRYIRFLKELVKKGGLFCIGGKKIYLEFFFIADMSALWQIIGYEDCFFCDISLNDYVINMGGKGKLKTLNEVKHCNGKMILLGI